MNDEFSLSNDLEIEEKPFVNDNFDDVEDEFDEVKYENDIFSKAMLLVKKGECENTKASFVVDEDICESNSFPEPLKANNESDEFDGRLKQDEWKGKNDDAKSERKKFAARITTSILNTAEQCRPSIPILQNGSNLKNKSSKRTEIITQACSFNSLFHIYCAVYTDYAPFKRMVDASKCDLALLIQLVIKDRTIDVCHLKRGEILIKYMSAYCQIDAYQSDVSKHIWPRVTAVKVFSRNFFPLRAN